jgi:uncharacterized protein YrrD
MDLGKPGSYLSVSSGVPVYSSDGERLGAVTHVMAEADKDIFDGLVFDASPLPGGHRFVDAPEVEAIYERGVVLKLDAAGAKQLPEPGPSELEIKLRRAWDLISGNY